MFSQVHTPKCLTFQFTLLGQINQQTVFSSCVWILFFNVTQYRITINTADKISATGCAQRSPSIPMIQAVVTGLIPFIRNFGNSNFAMIAMLGVMLVLMLILPPLSSGQIMIWWSTVFARILSAVLALLLTKSNK